MASDGLNHGRPKETKAIVCECECSRWLPCPADNDSACKQAYIARLKAMKAERSGEDV